MEFKKYLPWSVLAFVSILGFFFALFQWNLIGIVVLGVIGYFTGKKVYDIYKAGQ